MNEAQYFAQFSGVEQETPYHDFRVVKRVDHYELQSTGPEGILWIWFEGKPYHFLNSGQYYRQAKTEAEAWRHLPE